MADRGHAGGRAFALALPLALLTFIGGAIASAVGGLVCTEEDYSRALHPSACAIGGNELAWGVATFLPPALLLLAATFRVSWKGLLLAATATLVIDAAAVAAFAIIA